MSDELHITWGDDARNGKKSGGDDQGADPHQAPDQGDGERHPDDGDLVLQIRELGDQVKDLKEQVRNRDLKIALLQRHLDEVKDEKAELRAASRLPWWKRVLRRGKRK